MTHLLFLDIDGVLHARNSGRLDKTVLVEQLLDRQPSLSLVISSNWRAAWHLSDLKEELFPRHIDRIEGATPLEGYIHHQHYGSRGSEIFSYLEERGRVPFLAVDDSIDLFSSDFYPYLVQTQRSEGLTPFHVEEIERRLFLS